MDALGRWRLSCPQVDTCACLYVQSYNTHTASCVITGLPIYRYNYFIYSTRGFISIIATCISYLDVPHLKNLVV